MVLRGDASAESAAAFACRQGGIDPALVEELAGDFDQAGREFGKGIEDYLARFGKWNIALFAIYWRIAIVVREIVYIE